MKLTRSVAQFLCAVLAISLLPLSGANAAPSLNDVRTKIRVLQEEASAAGEKAQQAKVEYQSLTRKLESV